MTIAQDSPSTPLIKHLRLVNFKRFSSFHVAFGAERTILVGDNEAGKSTILLALDLLLGGSRSKVESIGLENLFTKQVVEQFMQSERTIASLPKLVIEAYVADQDDPGLNGRNNLEARTCDGLSLVCEPNDLLSEEIAELLRAEDARFPFEFYEIRFHSFAARPYAAFNRPFRHLMLDGSEMNSEYARRAYVTDLYRSNTDGTEKSQHENAYRRHKVRFEAESLSRLNSRLTNYSFVLRASGRDSLESDLTISENGIAIENRGRGKQAFIKTEFSLSRSEARSPIDVLLLEEPENHLSHVNMKRLISRIAQSSGQQVVIATHHSLVSARLDLRNCVLLSENSQQLVSLASLPDETARFPPVSG